MTNQDNNAFTLSLSLEDHALLTAQVRKLSTSSEQFYGLHLMHDLRKDRLLLFTFQNQDVPTMVSCRVRERCDYLPISETEDKTLKFGKIGWLFPSANEGYFLTAFQCKYLLVGPEKYFEHLKRFERDPLNMTLKPIKS
jgi:hypothetical protein